jgi:hypothetical protein
MFDPFSFIVGELDAVGKDPTGTKTAVGDGILICWASMTETSRCEFGGAGALQMKKSRASH